MTKQLNKIGIVLCAALFLVLRPELTLAANPLDIIRGVTGWLPTDIGGLCTASGWDCAVSLVDAVIVQMRPLITMIAGLLIVIEGFRMIIGQEDEIAGRAKTVMTATISGLVLLYLYRPFFQAFYGNNPWTSVGGISNSARIVSAEVAGIINWALTIAGVIAITMIVITGLRAIATSGSEDGTAMIRKNVLSIGSGIFLIIVRGALNAMLGLAAADTGGSTSPGQPQPSAIVIIHQGVVILQYLMTFIGLVALVIVMYAGIQMVLNFGNEEVASKSRGLLTRAGLGLLVISVSVVIVRFVMQIV